MLPQFTCPECGDHQLTLVAYVKCEHNVEIGSTNIHYEETEIDYDDTLPLFTCFHCSRCNHLLTTEHGEDVTHEEQLRSYLHNQSEFSAGIK